MPEGQDVPFKEYVDSQLQEVRRAVEVAVDSVSGEAVPLREFFTAILDEQRRGMLVAEQEREKSARALRAELERAISEGDRNLREHITQQVQQINAALESGDKLEIQRVKEVAATVAAVQRELSAAAAANNLAVEKAERSVDRRLEGMNQFREQLSEQATGLVTKDSFAELTNRVGQIEDRINRSLG